MNINKNIYILFSIYIKEKTQLYIFRKIFLIETYHPALIGDNIHYEIMTLKITTEKLELR